MSAKTDARLALENIPEIVREYYVPHYYHGFKDTGGFAGLVCLSCDKFHPSHREACLVPLLERGNIVFTKGTQWGVVQE